MVETQDFFEMKSVHVTTKPRIDEYIHEQCHRPISKAKLDKYTKERTHARITAKYKSRK
jgi:hypothetical protein